MTNSTDNTAAVSAPATPATSSAPARVSRMRVYKTRSYPWQYLVYKANNRELDELDASGLFSVPRFYGRKTPQRECNATKEAEQVLLKMGVVDIPRPEPPHAWAAAEEERRYSEQWEHNNPYERFCQG